MTVCNQVGWWHIAKGCYHFAWEIGDECGRTDGRWEPVVRVTDNPHSLQSQRNDSHGPP
jgi:hypothetical protein